MRRIINHHLITLGMIVLWCFSLYLGVYFLIAALLYMLHPSAAFPITLILPVGGPGAHATNLLLLTAFGVMLNLIRKKQKLKSFFILPKKQLLIIIPSAYWLADFYASRVPVISSLDIIGRLTTFVFFLFFLPLVIEYFASQSFRDLASQIQHLRHSMPKRLLLVPLGVFLLILLYNGMAIRENNLRGYFLIRKIYPTHAIYATTVKLTGYNFGWKEEGKPRYKLNSEYGEIVVKEWNSGYVIFDVPLHLKTGKVTVWLEKPTTDEGIASAESNRVTFTLIDRDTLYPGENADIMERGIEKLKRFFIFEIGIPFKIGEPGKHTTN